MIKHEAAYNGECDWRVEQRITKARERRASAAGQSENEDWENFAGAEKICVAVQMGLMTRMAFHSCPMLARHAFERPTLER